ncbi:MAG: hypothetical protein LBO05_08295 [Deltaproteobacteria bacterium]|jgi:hypothetical protein|nr:hypothetical protein [Deltaproteobacteria bacterium]
MLAIIAVFLLSAPEASGKSMTIEGDAAQSEKNARRNEAAVESGRSERERNTVAPLVPIVEELQRIAEESAKYGYTGAPDGDSEPASGYKAVLSCSNGFMVGSSQDSASSSCGDETKQSCLERFARQMKEKYGGPFSVCSKVNSAYPYGDSYYLKRE